MAAKWHLGGVVREARIRLRLSQPALAKSIGCDKATISKWESGEQRPTEDNKDKLAAALGIDRARLDDAPDGATVPRPSHQDGAARGIPYACLGKPETLSEYTCNMMHAPAVGHIRALMPDQWGESTVDLVKKPHGLYKLRVLDDSLDPIARPGWSVVVDNSRAAADGELALADSSVGEGPPICHIGWLHREGGQWQLNPVKGPSPAMCVGDPNRAWPIAAILPG